MLKIKDNVDLKLLEKYKITKDLELSDDYEIIYSVSSGFQKLCIIEDTREIFLYEPFASNSMDLMSDILYDLIQDGLVKKSE